MGGSCCWQQVACGTLHRISLGTWAHPPLALTPQCLPDPVPSYAVHAMDEPVSLRIAAQTILFLSGEINTDFSSWEYNKIRIHRKMSVWVCKDYSCICICYHSLLWLWGYHLYIPWHYTAERTLAHIIFSCILFIMKTSDANAAAGNKYSFFTTSIYHFVVIGNREKNNWKPGIYKSLLLHFY